jgi:hypothetical protein
MNDAERVILHNALIEANRALMDMAMVDLNKGDLLEDVAMIDGLSAYHQLRLCQKKGLSPAESTNVQGVLDRLRAHLKFFGGDPNIPVV